MKALVISQYFPPEADGIVSAIAGGLSRRGHQARVLTGYPNYPEGRVFAGYSQRWRGHDTYAGMDVLRVPLYADHSQSAVRRALNYLSFGLSAATARRFAAGADVIYVYATQMTPALGPWLWRLTGGAPYVLHVQDLWPDSITGSSLIGKSRSAQLIDRILSPWLTSVYRHASAVICIAPTMMATLADRGVAPQKLKLVYNWAGEPDQAGAEIATETPPSGMQVLYAGNIGDMQDLETAVRAAHAAKDSGVRLTIVGDGVALPKVRALAEELGSTNIEFHPRVPSEQIGALYQAADFSLVSLKDLPAFRGTIPSKFQGSLCHGVPIITTVQGDLAALVGELSVGFTADAESPTSLEAAFRAAADCSAEERTAMATRARQAYTDRFSQRAGVDAIASILETVAAKTG